MSASISACGRYRYRLERDVALTGPVYAFFGINPSIADAIRDDPTVRKWIGFARVWGASRFIVGNVSPLRATAVRLLKTQPVEDHAYQANQAALRQIILDADFLVPCWGDRYKVPRVVHAEIDELLSLIKRSEKPVMHLGLTKGGDPKHPLMLAYDTPLTPL
ncbi:MAG: DUF1643 domain-containing protein [Hydrogenophaga sp.]|nr:DUF1643 domain-containing protein [Hydrogenophaga sp.]